MIDKAALLENCNCIDVAKYIGINVVQKGTNSFMLCPGHFRRLGKHDNKIGNCVVYPDGYICFACDPTKKHDVFEMVMEHENCSFPEALETVADLYGGKSLYTRKGFQRQEKLPLTADDLAIIGIKSSGKIVLPQESETTYTLLSLKRDNEKAFRFLLSQKALEAKEKYEKAIESYCSRSAPKAGVVYNLFEENGCISDSAFFGLKNALQKRIWRCEEIYNAQKEEQ